MDWRRFQASQHLTELDGQFISYIDEGQGTPVVLLHGIPTWGYLWSDIIGEMSRERRVLAPDLLGFGFSDKSDHFDRSIARQTEAIYGWLQKLQVDRVDVAGHNIGGGIAVRLAVEHPEFVRRMALMNTVAYDSWPVDSMLPLLDARSSDPQSLLPSVREAIKKGCQSAPSTEVISALLTPYRTQVGMISLCRNAAAMNTNQTTELTPRLSQIAARTLVIWGENDAFQPVAYGERLRMDIPDCRLVRISGAGHFVTIDQPSRIVEELKAFLTV